MDFNYDKKKEIIDIIENDPEIQTAFLDHLDECIVGYSYESDSKINVIYSYDLILKKLTQVDKMDHMEAVDYFEYNINRLLPYLKEKGCPIIMY